MAKTLIYFVLVVLLGAGVYYFLFRERELFGDEEAAFKITDTAEIAKIYMAGKNGHHVTLSRQGDGWLLDEKYPASPATVNTLLKTLSTQNAMYPVPEGTHNNVIKMLAAKAVKVELYDKEGKAIKVFYIGGQAGGSQGTYMLMEGADRPYVVQIPGFQGYIAPRYSTLFDDWRDRLVCNIPQGDLKMASVTYTSEPLNSFALHRSKEGQLSVVLDPALNFNKKDFNGRRATAYSTFFERLYCEGYLNGTTDINATIAASPKRCVVDIESWSGQKQHIEVYWMGLNKRSKNRITPFGDEDMAFDADRFYAVVNNFKDTVILQRQMFEKLFRKGYEFYQVDDTTSKNTQIPINSDAGSIIMKK